MMYCAIVGPHMAASGEAVRVDVVVRDVPEQERVRIRLERSWPDPATRVDEWKAPPVRAGTVGSITFSFLWRAEPEPERRGAVTAVLRASVWTDHLVCAATHGITVFGPEAVRPPEPELAWDLYPSARA